MFGQRATPGRPPKCARSKAHSRPERPIKCAHRPETGYNVLIKSLLRECKIDRKVPIYNEARRTNEYLPICELGSSKLARKTHVDMLSKVQINLYAAGLHKQGSSAVNRYTSLEVKDRSMLINMAFNQKPYKVNSKLEVVK